MQYQPPVNDIKFVLFDVLGADELQTLEKYSEATPDIICAVIEEAGKLAAVTLREALDGAFELLTEFRTFWL